MLNRLYENIGGKIKGWAVGMFILEAFGAIIGGFVLMVSDFDTVLYGLLTIIFGPIIAWVSTWILYAFGELVEDTHALRNSPELKSIDENLKVLAAPAVKEAKKAKQEVKTQSFNGVRQQAGQNFFEEKPDVEDETAPWRCAKCGTKNIYTRTNCWSCGTERAPASAGEDVSEETEVELCPVCGANVTADTQQCHVCGYLLK